MNAIESQSVSWWPVHEFITALVERCNGPLPWAGTPAWCRLADSDPRKLLAVAVDGDHHVLRKETAQEARAEASQAVSESADWPGIAREITQRHNFYTARPWLRSTPSEDRDRMVVNTNYGSSRSRTERVVRR